tara:strand:- start:379 stop:621 length:243 start_codon:yes stop_codon:yes gene_type:complete
MKLQVLLFGISTDLVGATNLSFSLSPSSSVLQFKEQMQKKYPQLSQINSYAIAVNESYASDETVLKENDVIAIIPPVSGG